MKDLDKYKNQNLAVSEAAFKSFAGHLWYLCPELICFAFFDVMVSIETKKEMVSALEKRGSAKTCHRVKLLQKDVNSKNLSDFVSQDSLNFFKILNINYIFCLSTLLLGVTIIITRRHCM